MEGIEQQVKILEDIDLTFVLFYNEIVLFGDSSGKITAWNTWTSDFDFILEHKSGFPTSAVLYDDNNYLAAGYSSGEVVVWSILDKSQEEVIKTVAASINSISFSSSSKKKTIVVSNERRELVFVDLHEKKVTKVFNRHSDAISAVLQTQDGKLVISASHDKLIKIWQKGEFREYKSSKLGSDIKCSALHKDSNSIAIAYNNLTVKLVNLADDKVKVSLAWKGQSVYAAIWSHDKKHLITSNGTPEIAVFSYERKVLEYTIPCDSSMTCLVLSPNSKLLYGCDGGSKIFCWNFKEKTISHVFESEGSSSHYVIAFSPDWSKMYSGGDCVINIWDMISKTIENKLNGNTSSVRCLVSLSDGETLISGGNDGKVIFWNLRNQKLDTCIEENAAWARSMDLFNEEKFLAVVHDTSKVTVVNIKDKKIEYDFSVSSQFSCKVLNDSTLIMADSENIRFWNLAQQKEEAVINAHKGSIYSLLIDKDSDTLISFSSDMWIKSWKISDKSQKESFQTFYGKTSAVCLTGDYLGIATEEGKVLIYSTSSADEIKILPVHPSIILSLDYNNGNFATGSDDEKVGLFNMNDYKIHYFEGHTDKVMCVRFSNDGQVVFSADNHAIRAWNIEKKSLEYKLEGDRSSIFCLCIFPSGKFLASGTKDKKVTLWNLSLGKEQNSFESHSSSVLTLCVSDDERFLFSGSSDNTISVIDLNIKKAICSIPGHSSPITNLSVLNNVLYSTSSEEIKNWLIKEKQEVHSFQWDTDYPYHLALSPNQIYLAAAFNEGSVRIYDLKKKKTSEPFQPFGSNISRLAFTHDSKSLLLGSAGNNILVWDIKNKKGLEFPAAKTEGRNLVFSPDFSLLATFSDDFKAIVWNWSDKKISDSLEGHSSDSQVMIFSPDNLFLFVGTDDGSVFKWNLENRENHQFKAHSAAVKGLALSGRRKLLVSGSHDKQVCFYDLENNEVSTQGKHTDWVRAMVITNDENFVVSAGDDRVLIVWNLDSKEEAFRLEGHSNYIYGLAMMKDNNNIFSGSGDKSIVHWSLFDKKKLKDLRSFCGSIYCIVLTKDGKKAYTGSDENTINVFDLSSKTEIVCLSDHLKAVCDLALSDDETLLVSGSWDNSVRVYDTRNFEDVAVFKDVHTDYVRSVAITRNKEFVVSGSDDRVIVFWNLERKEKDFTLEGHSNYIYSVRLTCNEDFLISASRDETLKLWDVHKKSEVFTFIGHTGPIRCLAVLSNNETFISGGEDSLIKAWSIKNKREDYSLKGHDATITTLKLTTDNLRLISGSEDTKINIWDLELKVVKLCLSGNSSSILAVNITEDGSNILSAANDKVLKIWKMSEHGPSKDESLTQKPFVHVHTPDDKFELKYLYGKLSEEVKKTSNSSKLEMAITDVYDPYYQNLLKFYNLIDNIRGGQFDTLLTSSDVVFSKFLYTTLHILANVGNSKILSKMFSPDIQFKTDYFGKSPLYYALVKQNQDCIDRLLNFLIQLSELKETSKIQSSFSAISKELPMIIRNSSKSLHVLLRSCLIPTNLAFAKTEKDLPIFRFNSNFVPITNDFVEEEKIGVDNIPVIMMHTPFTLPCKVGSRELVDILGAIIECDNKNIYNTHLVQHFLQIQWDLLIHWVLGYAFLLWFNLALLVVLLVEQGKITESWALPIFLIVNFMLVLWESIQLRMQGFLQYFGEPWNFVDFFRFWSTLTWVILRSLDENQPDYRILTWIVALLNFTRGLTGFRLFDGTRYYVRLILRAMKDMGYFIILLTYSTFTFGVLFQVARYDEYFVFRSLWMNPYTLNFGNFDALDGYKFSYEAVTYILATVINVILMLNLLISILGDSFDRFQEEKVLIDYSEKASVILEIQTMFFWVGQVTENKYFHVMCLSGATDEEQTMDEKIDNMGTSLNNLHDEARSSTETSKEIANQIQNLESEVKAKFAVVEGKITGLEEKVGQFEGKFKDVNETLIQILDFVKPQPEEKKEKDKK